MASIRIRNLSSETKAKLRRRAEERGCSLEAPARSILDQAAEETPPAAGFPRNLIALVEPGDDIEPFVRDHGQPQEPVETDVIKAGAPRRSRGRPRAACPAPWGKMPACPDPNASSLRSSSS